MTDYRKRLEDARERWRHNTDAARVNVRLGDLRKLLSEEAERLRSLVEEAGKEIDWQDIRLAAGEGPLKGRDVFDAVNVILNDRRHSLLDKLKGEGQ